MGAIWGGGEPGWVLFACVLLCQVNSLVFVFIEWRVLYCSDVVLVDYIG